MPIATQDLERLLRDWPRDLSEALTVQERLRHQVEQQDRLDEVRTVAGLDLGFIEEGTVARAAAVVLSYPELQPLDQAVAYLPVEFPYIPGFLSFREVPAGLHALAGLKLWPDLILCDGQGLAHPRRFGLACHLGVLADVPTIGCAKSLLIGRTPQPLEQERGSHVPLLDRGEQIGVMLRTRTGTQPLYVSLGHRISLETAISYVLSCAPRYRLPETTRRAHNIASGLAPGGGKEQN